MILVNLGSVTINAQHVLAFQDDGMAIRILFNTSQAGEAPYTMTVEGEAAAVLRVWLQKNAERKRDEITGFSLSGGR